HLTVAHTQPWVTPWREPAETNRLLGVDSRLTDREELARLVPALDVSHRPHQPILAGLYHPPGGIIRHDAVVWGYARGVDRQGIQIHPLTEVTGIERENGRVKGVLTNRGGIATGTVINATAGWCSIIAHMAGVELPIVTYPLQA